MNSKKLNLNINPLVSLLTSLFVCGKNAVYKSKDIAYRLVQSAVHGQSLEAMYKLTQYLSADRMLSKLHELCEEDIRKIILKCNRKLTLPKSVMLAIDFTEKEYYGDKNHPNTIGSKKGRYVNRHIQVSTVKPALFIDAMHVDQFNHDKETLLIKLLGAFSRQFEKTSIKLLLLDKGFYTKKVIKLLIANKIPFIMPVIRDKRIQREIKAFRRGEISNKIKYQFGDSKINLLFLKIEDDVLVYATNTRKNVLSVHILYAKRWQIETNFREQHRFTFKTCTRDFMVRYFVFALAGLLFNAWQLTRKITCYSMESYLFKQVLMEELLKVWQKISKRDVVKSIDYFLVA